MGEIEFAVAPKKRKATMSASTGKASQAISRLLPGCRVVGITKGQFSLLDLICAVLAQIGPAEVLVSTWTPGKREMDAVADMLDSHEITRFRLLVDRSFVTRHPEYVANVQRILGVNAIRQTRTHAKFALISGGEYRIVIRTSMNFNRNPRFEQFDLDDDLEIFDFFERVVEDLYLHVPAGLGVESPVIVRAFRGFAFRGLGVPEIGMASGVAKTKTDREIDALLREFSHG